MSVLIKGMEMPACCTRCDYLGLNVAIRCPVMTGINGRATDCPLIEVPDGHGDLIDRDALINRFEEGKKIAHVFGGDLKEIYTNICNDMIRELLNAKVVIPENYTPQPKEDSYHPPINWCGEEAIGEGT